MNQTIRMKIEYIDGTNQTFEWHVHPENIQMANTVSQLQNSLHEEYVLLEMGDKFTIVPKYNIKTIEINPVPPKLPPGAILGARLVE